MFEKCAHHTHNSDVIEPDDILALAAAVYMFMELHLSPQQRYPRTLPELLAAVAARLARQEANDALVLHNAYTIQKVARAGFKMLDQLGYSILPNKRRATHVFLVPGLAIATGSRSRRLCGRRRKPRLEPTTTERRKFFQDFFSVTVPRTRLLSSLCTVQPAAKMRLTRGLSGVCPDEDATMESTMCYCS